MPLLIKQQILVFARWPPELVHICLELKMWCQHANVHHPMHEFKHRPNHWNRSPDYNVSWIVCLGFIYSLPTICDTPVWNRRTVPVGGQCGCRHLIPSMLQGRWEEKKEHNWIRYQNKAGVCFNYSSDTGSSWKLWEPAERENERKRKRWSKRGRPRGRGSEGKKGKEGSWGERTPGCGWIMRPEAGGGGAVWEVPDLSEFSVRSPNRVDSGHFHYHNTGRNMSQSRSVYKSSDKGNPWREEQPWNRLIICGGLFGCSENTVLLLLC